MLRGRRDVAPALLAELTPPTPTTWVAVVGGQVVGVLVAKWRIESAWRRVPWHTLRRFLSVPAVLRAAGFMMIFHSVKLAPGHLYVDMMAVDPRYRGYGAAGALLRAAEAETREAGGRAVNLYCIDRNHHARAVYEHAGYRFVRHENLWWCRWLLGFAATDLLELRLDDDRSTS
jgi:ribosomal protein S18 acetylase RimI-like enzyme